MSIKKKGTPVPVVIIEVEIDKYGKVTLKGKKKTK